MDLLGALAGNLLSPIVLAFALGVLAALLRSPIGFPEELYRALSIYLLLAIGLRGGAELGHARMAELWAPALVTLLLGLLTPLSAYLILRRLGRLDRTNAAAIAAHYGSVSAVTFIAAQAFGRATGAPGEGFMPTLVALLEAPAIVVALLIARIRARGAGSWGEVLHEVLTGPSVFLLLGGVLIGWVAGPERFRAIEPFFVSGFQGALVLFLLELGIVAGRRLRDLRRVGLFLIGFGIAVPCLHGLLGVILGTWAGLSVGGSAILGAMAASASYIAAPAAVRLALPEANPTLYLTASLGITFPFNLTLGIPIYFAIAHMLHG
ncbi:MAG: sodium-dependent bicarbonate transport family permease [Bacteroidetes bacterium]|nr:sodium-dependent bicarbonate transport family permease [Rhodothermia bacterium]MCS7154346.1 sodium-dependent bicarbonate transport family permease [Bacteroidota bacterium]MCX7906617.1 sodium-dependent bicarbonate transport family permease [Bacteroidota bacterium]MDW8137102.1 sodium-dependent bicarbonate transport family permease [Bacteroidota bacterium]MDW8285027.1 sodium-dependent bicarbonate transport family permease [Bacteroidota bacterium]